MLTETTESQNLDPDKQALEAEVRALGLIKVVDRYSYFQAGERWKALVALEKKIHELFDPGCDAAHKAWKAAVALRDKFLDPVVVNKKSQAQGMKSWEFDEELKRVAEERRLQEEARKRAEEEILRHAAALEKEGFKQEAEMVIEEPVVVPQVVAHRVVPKGYGAATQKRWKAQVVDLKALIHAVAEGKVPAAAIVANDVFLGQQARSLRAEMVYPGVRVWEE